MPRVDGTDRARELRASQTQVEARLWSKLRAHRLGGWKWKRQVPRGPYIVDFLCLDALLVVELDGGQHADNVAYDDRRTAYLESQGLRVLRFWNGEVVERITDVCAEILRSCGGETPLPTLSPEGRGVPGDEEG
jgi:very-short-patch-repair endonuclease